ncbi:hypothetical protein Q7P35_010012 [Cladosporium inversicolor]
MSLNHYVNKKVLIITVDGRTLTGTLVSCDQVTNLVLADTVERIIREQGDDEPSTEQPHGLYLVRGDNVVVCGLVDEELDASIDWSKPDPMAVRVVFEAAKQISAHSHAIAISFAMFRTAGGKMRQKADKSKKSATGVGSAHAFGNSFEQLHSLHPLTPSDVPFPASNGSVSLNTTRTSIVASRDYASHSPDLDKRDYRHRLTGKVTCVDYLSHGDSRAGVTIHMKNVRSLSGRETMADRLKELITVEDSSVCSRIILVEDLCSESMEILGTAFELDSELFAMQERWNTSHLGKDFVAVTWCRPVHQNPLLTDWLRAPRKPLNKDLDATDGMSSVTWRDPLFTAAPKRNRLAREHQLRVDTNIFRRSWSLSAGIAGLDGQLRANDRTPGGLLDEVRSTLVPTAWQERASFCCV